MPTLANRWQASLADVQHYAETGKLRCSVWINETFIEVGMFTRQANGCRVFEPQESIYIEGFVGIMPEDCRKLFRNKRANTIIFVSLKKPNCYLHIAKEQQAKIIIEPKDLVVRIEDRDDFERIYELSITSSKEPESGFCENSPHVYIHSSKKFSYSKDFQTVTIDGEVFRFGMVQAKIISLLYRAYKDGNPWLYGKALLFESGSHSERIKNVFQSKPNWRKLIESDGHGYYRLVI